MTKNTKTNVTKITQLTKDQEAQMPAYRDARIAIGLCTEPANRTLAETSYRECYGFAKLNSQIPIVWAKSPQVGAYIAPLAAILLEGVERFMAGELNGLSAKPSKAINILRVKQKDPEKFTQAIREGVHNVLSASRVGKDYTALDDAAKGKINAWLGDQTIFWHSWMGGQFWQWFHSWEGFFREVCNLVLPDDLTDRAISYDNTSKSAGYWFPNENFIVACERPIKILRDAEGRLHSQDSLAIEWPDGWGLAVVHGVRVPEFVVNDPSKITVDVIDNEENVEVRRVMTDVYGLEKYVLDSGAKVIHQDDWGTLYRKEVKDDEPIILVDLVNSTPEPDGTFKKYQVQVPPHITRAKEAVAWTFGLSEDEYNPIAMS